MARRERFSVAVLEVLEGFRLGDTLTDFPLAVDITAAAGGTNVSEVTFQLGKTNAQGEFESMSGVYSLDIYLSDAADGEGLTGTTASGTVTAKSSSGTVIGTLTAKKALRVQTTDAGLFILEITDTAKTGFYPVGVLPFGNTEVGDQLVTADYG